MPLFHINMNRKVIISVITQVMAQIPRDWPKLRYIYL